VVEQRANVLLEAGDHRRIREKRCSTRRSGIGEILTHPTVLAVDAVADQGNDQAQAAIVRSLESVVDVRKSFRIELAQLGLNTEIVADAVAQGLGTDDASTHRLGRVQGVVHFKLAGVTGAHRTEGAVVYQAEPFNVGPAVAEDLATKSQAGSVALNKFVVVFGLHRTLGTHWDHGQRRQGHRGEGTAYQVPGGISHVSFPLTMPALHA
jgi:hypothetical protein